MKIQVDDKGWAVVTESDDSNVDANVKPTSGVYPKADDETKHEDVASLGGALGEAPTEPSIPSQEAINQGAAPLPPPSALPADLMALHRAG